MKNRIYLFITIISLSIVCFIFYYYNHQTDDITKKYLMILENKT